MAKTLLLNPAALGSAGTTRYNTIVGHGAQSATEAQKQAPIYSAGTFDNLKAKVLANGSNGTLTPTLRVNGVDSSVAVAVTSGSTGLFEDTTNSKAVVSTDLVNYVVNQTGSSGNVTFSLSIAFAATTGTAQLFILGSGESGSHRDNVAATVYHPIIGAGIGTTQETTENNVEFTLKTGGTIRNAFWYVGTNAKTGATTATVRKAGADTAVVISVNAAATGLHQDTSNTATFVSGDTINWEITTANVEAGDLTATMLGCEFITADSTFQMICGTNTNDGQSQNGQLTRYSWIGGIASSVDTEANQQTKVSFDFTASNLQIYIVASDSTETGTCELFKNGSATALSISVSAASTGLFVDDSNTVAVLEDDTLSIGLLVSSEGAETWFVGTQGLKGTVVSSLIKTINGLARDSIKTRNGLALESIKNRQGLA